MNASLCMIILYFWLPCCFCFLGIKSWVNCEGSKFELGFVLKHPVGSSIEK